MSFTLQPVLIKQESKLYDYKNYKDYCYYNNENIRMMMRAHELSWIYHKNYKDDYTVSVRRPENIDNAINWLKKSNYIYNKEDAKFGNNIGSMFDLLEEMKLNNNIYLIEDH